MKYLVSLSGGKDSTTCLLWALSAANKDNPDFKLGKPEGTVQASIYDKDQQRIFELLDMGLSQSAIIKRHLGYGSKGTLSTYIKKRYKNR